MTTIAEIARKSGLTMPRRTAVWAMIKFTSPWTAKPLTIPHNPFPENFPNRPPVKPPIILPAVEIPKIGSAMGITARSVNGLMNKPILTKNMTPNKSFIKVKLWSIRSPTFLYGITTPTMNPPVTAASPNNVARNAMIKPIPRRIANVISSGIFLSISSINFGKYLRPKKIEPKTKRIARTTVKTKLMIEKPPWFQFPSAIERRMTPSTSSSIAAVNSVSPSTVSIFLVVIKVCAMIAVELGEIITPRMNEA